jgi:hypothetical protein
MKRKIFMLSSLLVLVFTISCKENASSKINQENVNAAQQEVAKAGEYPQFTFDKTEHDFGTINEGDVAKTTFKFTNTGKSPLIIARALGSCGCTVPSYPKEAIAPGESGEIQVAFDSSGKPNLQQKVVTLFANTEKGKELLKIKAVVTPDPNKAASYQNNPIN